MCYLCVSSVRGPAFGCNSAPSPPFELVLCALELPWSRTVRDKRHCRVCVSLAAFVSPRTIPRGVHNLPQSYPFDVVSGSLGAPQAAEKIQDRTCVLILEHCCDGTCKLAQETVKRHGFRTYSFLRAQIMSTAAYSMDTDEKYQLALRKKTVTEGNQQVNTGTHMTHTRPRPHCTA